MNTHCSGSHTITGAGPTFGVGKICMVGILQTWTRDLRYHPHILFLVPGGGLASFNWDYAEVLFWARLLPGLAGFIPSTHRINPYIVFLKM